MLLEWECPVKNITIGVILSRLLNRSKEHVINCEGKRVLNSFFYIQDSAECEHLGTNGIGKVDINPYVSDTSIIKLMLIVIVLV